MIDLDEAIVLKQEALELRLQGQPGRSMSLNDLAVNLSTRYNQLGAMQDSKGAIVLDREVLDLRPKGHPDRSIALAREALGLRPKGNPNHSLSLNNLADALSTRYRQFGLIQDLNEAIVLHREALDLRPK